MFHYGTTFHCETFPSFCLHLFFAPGRLDPLCNTGIAKGVENHVGQSEVPNPLL